MSGDSFQTAMRFKVAANYAGVLAAAILFLLGKYRGWNLTLGICGLTAVAIVVASFIAVYLRTGLWKLVHTKVERLDEREINLTHESLRRSYQIFTIFSLLLFAALFFLVRFSANLLTFRGHFSLGLLLVIVVPYLVHTLPAAIIACGLRRSPVT